MKERLGFVSNSSSSSFVCDTCGESFSGWDASPSDFDHIECVNEHIFCECHLVNQKLFEHLCDLYDEGGGNDMDAAKISYTDYGKPETYRRYGLSEDDRYQVPAEFCPVCQMEFVSSDELNAYIYKTHDLDQKVIIEEIKGRFPTYDAFRTFLKNG